MAAITTTGTLTAGNSRTFALAPGSALTLTLLPNCRVTVTETPETVSASDAGGNSPRTHNHQFAGVFTYGPYVMGGSVVVDNASNSGSTVTWGRKDTTVSISSDGLSLVSGDGNTFPLTTNGLWANRAALAAAGSVSVFFTDVGLGGSFWFYSGGRWRPQSGRVMLKNSITDVTNNLAPEIVMDYATLLPGLWQDGDILDIAFRKSRTGGTSDTDSSILKIGTTALTAGTVTGLGSAAGLAGTTIEMGIHNLRMRRLSNTSFRILNPAGITGLGAGTSAINDVTIGNMDAVTHYLQVMSDLTTAGGEVAVLRWFTVELISGA